jgi:ribonuclease HII
LPPSSKHKELFDQIKQTNKPLIVGVDEVSTGALAGNVCVSAFCAPTDWTLKGLKDSKAVSKEKRDKLYAIIVGMSDEFPSIKYSIASTHPNHIDKYRDYGTNLHGLLKFLYWNAVNSLNIKSDYLIVLDGVIKFPEYPRKLSSSISLPKADVLIPQVSAASIIAKVSRDRYMRELAKQFPEYGWDENSGYPTPSHLEALKKFGYCSEHRVSYEPIKGMIKNGHANK